MATKTELAQLRRAADEAYLAWERLPAWRHKQRREAWARYQAASARYTQARDNGKEKAR